VGGVERDVRPSLQPQGEPILQSHWHSTQTKLIRGWPQIYVQIPVQTSEHLDGIVQTTYDD
jgi:hypothetical protein